MDHHALVPSRSRDSHLPTFANHANVRSNFDNVDAFQAEQYEAHVLDLESAHPSKPVEILENVWSVEWAGDSTSLLYTRPDDLRRPASLFEHTPMTRQDKDRLVYEEDDDEFFLDVSRTKDDAFVTISSNSKTSSEVRVLPGCNAAAGLAGRQALLLHPREDGVTYFVEHADSMFYFVTNADGAADYKIMRAPETAPGKSAWEDFIGARPGYKVEDADMFRTGCMVLQRSPAGLRELCWAPYADPASLTHVQMPAGADVGSVVLHANTDFDAQHVGFSTTSPLAPQTDWRFDMTNSTVSSVGSASIVGRPRFDPGQYACTRTTCTSTDGAEVPVTLVHRRGLALDGGNPALVSVYAAYGECLEPEFRAEHLPFLQRGWVIALCHARGGGELGDEWHRGGSGLRKHASIDDLESCIDAIQKRGYTQKSLTVAIGASAGALPVAALCNRRPDLLAAVVLRVPYVDPLSAMLDPTLPLTIHERPEWGDPIACADTAEYIRSYCPYFNVENGVQYPAVLATTSLVDERVPSWQPAKYVARIRAAAGALREGAPRALLLADTESGHFGSVDFGAEVAFMFESLGLPLDMPPDD